MKDLTGFLKEEDKTKPHKGRKGEGADDKKYFALMSEYKQLRRNPKNRDEANKVLEKAKKLGRDGDVSKDAKLGAAYL